jgi:hypothetical protein
MTDEPSTVEDILENLMQGGGMAKKKRGRPRKEKPDAETEETVKRPRGRPRKVKTEGEEIVKRPPGRPRKEPVVKVPISERKQKQRDELDKNWTPIYEAIKAFDPDDQSYQYRQGMLDSAKTWLFDQIVKYMEKKFYE